MSKTWFEARERALLGDAYDAMYAAPALPYRGITVNGLRCSPAAFAARAPFLLEPSPFCDASFLLRDAAVRPGLSPYHHAGVYYVQEPSAAAPASLLQVKPGDRVLDVCAAPGGKTSQLASALRGSGLLIANEYVPARAAVLRSNLERMGVRNAVVLCEDTARLAAAFPLYFTKVLVDAPCSGEGMFRKEPEALAQHSEALVQRCATLGHDILANAAACLAPGGVLVYSTCTFSPQEDEAQIGRFLTEHADFTLDALDVSFGAPGEAARCEKWPFYAAGTRRIYPCHGGEGHYMARMRRKEEPEHEAAATSARFTAAGRAPRKKAAGAKQLPPEVCRFFAELFPAVPQSGLRVQGDAVSVLPLAELPPLDSVRALQVGVQAGALVKGRFEPAHHLFMAYSCANAEQLARGDTRVDAWLRGEEIEAATAAPGYTAVLYDGFPLGFGKQSGGKIKNRYPKGLRNLK